ncbi:MAG: hypothetical protein ABSA70_13340, partial [Terriglobia bacterium]
MPRVLVLLLFALGMCLGAPLQTAPGAPDAMSPPAVDAPQAPVPLKAQEPSPTQEEEPAAQITHKQKRDLLKQNFEKMKRDAEELAALAKALQEDLDKSNENLLSLQVVNRAEKIEKLAKRIKSTA